MEGGNTTERGGGRREGKESARISHFPKVGTAFGFPETESERDYSAKSASL